MKLNVYSEQAEAEAKTEIKVSNQIRVIIIIIIRQSIEWSRILIILKNTNGGDV